jgi:protein ImuB
MLWLCIGFPRLPFDALSLDDNALAVVTATSGRTRRIVAGSSAAQRLGFICGMHYATAAALHEELQAFDRNLRAERKTLQRMAAWAYQWSSFVTLHQAGVATEASLHDYSALWLEIAGSFKLFGGRNALIKKIENELIQFGYEYRLGLAHSLEGAALLARAQRRLIVDSESALRRHIHPLPVSLLSLPDKTVFELERAGVRTIETLLALPRADLARRFGPRMIEYLDKLLGTAPDPRPCFQLPKKYRARAELGAEISDTEALLFPLRRMLGELQGYLRAIDSGVQRFIVHLKHRQSTTRLSIGLSAPARNAEQFFALLRERLERVTLPAPVLAIGLQADRFVAPVAQQEGLFAGVEQTTEQFQQVLDKLSARLGEEAVQGCKLVADHRPELAWNTARPTDGGSVSATSAPRPLWLLPVPRPIPPPKVSGVPERIANGWWQSDVQRDYYFVRDTDGAALWVYRDAQDQWFVHGLCG